MKPGECERNIWWHIVEQCRERGRVEPMEVYGLGDGGRWKMALLAGALLGAAVIGLVMLFGG